MVKTPVDPKTTKSQTVIAPIAPPNYEANPRSVDCFDEVPEGMELVNGELVEKAGMTLKHAATQGQLIAKWQLHAETSGQGGHVYPEAPCQTTKQKKAS